MDFLQTITFAGVVGFLTLVVGVLVRVIGLPDQIRKNYNRKSTILFSLDTTRNFTK